MPVHRSTKVIPLAGDDRYLKAGARSTPRVRCRCSGRPGRSRDVFLAQNDYGADDEPVDVPPDVPGSVTVTVAVWVTVVVTVVGTVTVTGSDATDRSADAAAVTTLVTVTGSRARSRTFTATIAATPDPAVPAGTLFRLVISGVPLVPGNDGFPIGVAGSFVNLEVWNGEGPGVVERLAPRTYVGLFGSAGTTVGAPGAPISASFDGTIEYCVATFDGDPSYGCTSVQTDRREQCESKNHSVTLTRR